jgi:hypothetical protein
MGPLEELILGNRGLGQEGIEGGGGHDRAGNGGGALVASMMMQGSWQVRVGRVSVMEVMGNFDFHDYFKRSVEREEERRRRSMKEWGKAFWIKRIKNQMWRNDQEKDVKWRKKERISANQDQGKKKKKLWTKRPFQLWNKVKMLRKKSVGMKDTRMRKNEKEWEDESEKNEDEGCFLCDRNDRKGSVRIIWRRKERERKKM